MAAQRDEERRSAERSDINHAISEMHHAMSDFYHRRHQVVMANMAPAEDAELRDLYLEFHTAVMHAFTKLRADVKMELEDEFWNTTDYDELTVQSGGDAYGGLQVMDEWYDCIGRDEISDYRRHEGSDAESVFFADLPSHHILRRVANLLHEAAKRLGYGATPERRTPRTEITREMIEDFEEWRQEVVDRMDPEDAEEYLRFLQNHE